MPIITIRIEGLDERISAIEGVLSGGLQDAKQSVLEQASEFMANEMRRNAHVITGNMRNSIISSVTGDIATVEVGAEYAIYENRRSGFKAGFGPHNFADMAANATIQNIPNIASKAYSDLFNRV